MSRAFQGRSTPHLLDLGEMPEHQLRIISLALAKSLVYSQVTRPRNLTLSNALQGLLTVTVKRLSLVALTRLSGLGGVHRLHRVRLPGMGARRPPRYTTPRGSPGAYHYIHE